MEKKVAFFDMDGTLVAPMFENKSGENVAGFVPEEWIEFCNEKLADAYDDCVPLECVLNCAKAMAANGIDTKILTITLSRGEEIAKKHWIDTRPEYLSVFSDIIFVPNEDAKIEYISQYIKENGIIPENCILVEDSFSMVLKSIPLGINAYHLSHIIAVFK